MSSRAVSAIDHSIAATLSLEGSSSIAGEWFAPWRGKRALLCWEELRTFFEYLAGGELTGLGSVTSLAPPTLLKRVLSLD